MRILSLSNAYLPHAGGIEVLLDATCAPLRQAGHELFILTGDGNSPPPGAITDDEWRRPTPGVSIERLDVEGPLTARDVRGIHRLHKRVRHILDEFQPDLVHAHDVGPLLWLYQRAAGSQATCPLIVTLHTLVSLYEEVPDGGVRATAHMLDRADVITGVSRDVVDDIIGFAPQVADRVIRIPNGIPAPAVPAATVDRHRVVSVGRLVPYKNHAAAIDAMAVTRARHTSTQLDILGEGPEVHALTDHITRSGLDHAVRLLGRRPHDEVLARVAGSTCLLMASRFEGLPLVALEAAWAGRPVVAFDAPGVREAVIHGEHGILVPHGDVHALGNAVAELIDDPARADRLGENARIRARQQYGIERYVGDLDALFEETVRTWRERAATLGQPV